MLESMNGTRNLNIDPKLEPVGRSLDGGSLSFGVVPEAPRALSATSLLREPIKTIMDVRRDVSENSFFTACSEGSLDHLAVLLRREPALIGARDPYGATGLVCAAIEGAAEVIDELLKRRADPSATDTMGATALAAAVCTGRVASVEHLVAVTSERQVPAGNVEAWANDAVLAPLGVEEMLDATRPWDMFELTQEIIQRLEAIKEEDLSASFHRIAQFLSEEAKLDTAAASAMARQPADLSGADTLEEQEEKTAELQRRLDKLEKPAVATKESTGTCSCFAGLSRRKNG